MGHPFGILSRGVGNAFADGVAVPGFDRFVAELGQRVHRALLRTQRLKERTRVSQLLIGQILDQLMDIVAQGHGSV